ncbi:hypothetical protein GJ744_010933 [Endocarpon pusillum]|uniref:Uncharacterized protein n=1 Tax=Endocarpon pusillum TaxID=364733 RepID=A0A8H7ADH9_9EURO|nr:hypothetical protein GJ744_010933 [Endocarpon pusillum]
MPHHHRMSDVYASYDSSSSEDYCTIPVARRHARVGSVVSSHHRRRVYEPVYARSPSPAYAPSSNLAVPVVDVGGRKRASSATGLPQPNIIINNADRGSRSRSRERTRRSSPSRSRSRERTHRRSPSRGRRFDEGEYEEFFGRRGRISRTPSPYYLSERVERNQRADYETRKQLEKLKILEEEKAAEEAEKKFKAEMELKKAKEQLAKAEAEEKRKALEKKAVEDWQKEQAAKKEAEEKRKALEKKAVEDWKREEEARKAKEKKEKEEQDKKVEQRLRQELADRDYSPAEIEAFLKKDKAATKRVEHERRIAHMRPTYIKVHKKYLLPETLDIYRLPWSYDSHDGDYILIETYVDDDLQEELFAHTKKIRSRKLIEPSPIEKKVIVKINDKKKDKMYLVRKKDTSPLRFGVLG